MFVICVVTTIISPKCDHTECLGKSTCLMEKGSHSHELAKETTAVDVESIGMREKVPI